MFRRIRTINGQDYLYEEHRWREGGRVRSKSRSLGRADGGGDNPLGEDQWRKHVQQRQDDQDRAYDSAIRQAEQSKRDFEAKAAKESQVVAAVEVTGQVAGDVAVPEAEKSAPDMGAPEAN